MNQWPFSIVMPTCNNYTRFASASLRLLDRFWPDRPVTLVTHFEDLPAYRGYATYYQLGPQAEHTWASSLHTFLTTLYHHDLVLLMLDDYGLCYPVISPRIQDAAQHMLDDPDIVCTHLTYQPVPRHNSNYLPHWGYSINTQAALWRTSTLSDLTYRFSEGSIWDFEHHASAWWNANQPPNRILEAPMDTPPRISSHADSMCKLDWPLPYHNLCHQGQPDSRHAQFLKENGLTL